jgi:integrase
LTRLIFTSYNSKNKVEIKAVNKIADKVTEANKRLKAGRVRVQMQVRGEKLCLQATLPPRPNSTRNVPHQQRIYLDVYATVAGIQFAEAEAKKVGALLDQHRFDWQPYLKESVPLIEKRSLSELVQEFKADKLAQGISDRTWKDDYAEVLDKLPLDAELSTNTILDLVRSTEPNTRTRRRYCLALSALAKFAKLDIDLSQYIGNYSPSKVQPRDIPSDESIEEWYLKIPNPAWQWAFGMLATYGIRPGELLSLNFDDLPILNVAGGKTGDRRVYPIYPEWFDYFSLADIKLLNISNSDQCSKQFRRYQVPFSPYDLRHAWAIRSMEFGLPIELAAAQMGHSMAVHSQTYHRWISDRHHARAYETIMLRPDRPRSPSQKTEDLALNR